MNLYIDPKKAWAANPVAAKAYGIPKPASYTPAPQYVTPAGLATYTAAKAAGKTYVAGQGYVTPTPAPTPTYYDLAAQLAKIAGYVSPTYVTPQPTEADYLKRKAEAERVLTYLRAAPTQAFVQGQGYVPYQPGLTPSYQEQLDRVAALKNQYSWLGTGTEVTAGTAPIGQIGTWQSAKDVFGQSQQGQSLLSSIQNWLGKAGQAFKTPLLGGEVLTQGFPGFGVPRVGGKAQAEAPTPGRLEDITAEEWAKMGRPPGGEYPELGPMAEAKTGLPTYIPPGVYKKEDKPWWEGGTRLVTPTPEQFNTPEYIQGYFNTLFDPGTHPELYDGNKLNAEGDKASENFWDAFTSDAKDGFYTPEQISKDPKVHENLVAEMLMRDKYDQRWAETLQDASLGKVITQVASQDPTKLPPTISQERLDAMVRGPDFATLYDTGYRSKTYQDEVTAGIQQAQSNGAQITYDPETLNSLTYANIEGLKSQLTQMSPAQWQTIVENGGQITLKTEFWKFNAKGEAINKGSWDIDYPPQSAMTQSEKDRYIDQQKFYDEWYWSDEATAQRQKERDESYAYSQEKANEGWAEYYATLDAMKLYPDANDYWEQPGKFAELRRQWETSGSGLSWDAWLQQFDFEGEWYAKPPQERGEKKYIYSPRMIRLNY
jgi:hypothetical protein